ncbi:polysaccharide deacetylase family protein [Halocatena marina]|uniref:polysaccharide deacetylase family protein n=1 Tax=Halocatena marina TaxID=2934937 RepID=UPI00200C612E|nr:polysaccharide deacetylase family protein [Halocatena marina]
MRRTSTRRRYLTALGAAVTVPLAGCSAVLPTGPADSNNTSTNSSTSTKPSSPGAGTDTNTETSQSGGPFSRGTVVENFEKKVGSRWQVSTGKYTVDKKHPYQGSQSLVLRGQNNGAQKQENGVSIYRSFYDSGGLDLRKHDLSIAVRFEQPVRGRLAVEFIAPAESSMLTSRHFLPKELNGWTRIDLGYTGKTGNPVMKRVQELRISVRTDGEPITIGIDDIRKLPKPPKGKVMFQFDDSHISTYTKAFPKLKEHDWTGGVAVIPDAIDTPENMTRNQMREMGSAGWDMMSHPPVAKPLPQLPPNEQYRMIRESKRDLTVWGFNDGARHIVAPYGRISTKTIEIMQKYHNANYIFGGSPGNAAHPSNMYAIPRVFGTSPDAVRDLLDLATEFNQLVVIAYHEIGGNTETSVPMKDFESVLTHVKETNMEVVSPSQFLESIDS